MNITFESFSLRRAHHGSPQPTSFAGVLRRSALALWNLLAACAQAQARARLMYTADRVAFMDPELAAKMRRTADELG
ncbi:MAG TPA: hypothetical protein VJ743_07945 [Albitalea sp.]|nr:hypothetical protein [Albitalea sp.]